MGYSKSQWEAKERMPCKNMFQGKIPPYACMMLDGYGSADTNGFGSYLHEGQALWRVNRCNEQGAQDQNPAVFFFNGPCEIAEGAIGSCTRAWPVQVLHDGRIDGLSPGMACGPVQDKWYVSSGGKAFACMGHTSTDKQVQGGAGFGNLHTVWITGERVSSLSHYSTWGAGSGGPGSFPVSAATVFGTGVRLTNDVSDDGITFNSSTTSYVYKKLRPNVPMMVTFSATLYSLAAAAGSILQLSMTHKRKNGALVRRYLVERFQDIERDNYGQQFLTTRENVAMAPILELRAEDTVQFKNESAVAVEMIHVYISFAQLGAPGTTKANVAI